MSMSLAKRVMFAGAGVGLVSGGVMLATGGSTPKAEHAAPVALLIPPAGDVYLVNASGTATCGGQTSAASVTYSSSTDTETDTLPILSSHYSVTLDVLWSGETITATVSCRGGGSHSVSFFHRGDNRSLILNLAG